MSATLPEPPGSEEAAPDLVSFRAPGRRQRDDVSILEVTVCRRAGKRLARHAAAARLERVQGPLLLDELVDVDAEDAGAADVGLDAAAEAASAPAGAAVPAPGYVGLPALAVRPRWGRQEGGALSVWRRAHTSAGSGEEAISSDEDMSVGARPIIACDDDDDQEAGNDEDELDIVELVDRSHSRRSRSRSRGSVSAASSTDLNRRRARQWRRNRETFPWPAAGVSTDSASSSSTGIWAPSWASTADIFEEPQPRGVWNPFFDPRAGAEASAADHSGHPFDVAAGGAGGSVATGSAAYPSGSLVFPAAAALHAQRPRAVGLVVPAHFYVEFFMHGLAPRICGACHELFSAWQLRLGFVPRSLPSGVRFTPVWIHATHRCMRRANLAANPTERVAFPPRMPEGLQGRVLEELALQQEPVPVPGSIFGVARQARQTEPWEYGPATVQPWTVAQVPDHAAGLSQHLQEAHRATLAALADRSNWLDHMVARFAHVMEMQQHAVQAENEFGMGGDGGSGGGLDLTACLARVPVEKLSEDYKMGPCAVCRDDMLKGQECRRLPCLHFFHKECIDRWLHVKATCPLDNLRLQDMMSAQELLGSELQSAEP
mmetsp:Transcript_91192/g.292771  ORF Transcript_91192/g.292771 Transcript_91192/m.292771 type:complete len:602 (-) Transcript_91192:51-1856(-)